MNSRTPLSFGLVGWIALLVLTCWASASLWVGESYLSAGVLGVGLGTLCVWQLHNQVYRTQRQFERLLDSISSDDLALRFADETEAAPNRWAMHLQTSVERFRVHRAKDATELALYRSMVEAAPIALVDLVDEQRILLLNRAARSMFRGIALSRIEDAPASLRAALKGLGIQEQRMVHLSEGATPSQLVLEAIKTFHDGQHHMIVAAKDVTQEVLSTQSETWSRVAQVLAHEINNSLTPITSLTHSMQEDLEELFEYIPDQHADSSAELRADLRDGMSTLGRRSTALMRFVEDYRRVSTIPRPQRAWIEMRALLDGVNVLLAPRLQEKNIDLRVEQEPSDLRLWADPDLVEQSLINLVKNAIGACEGCSPALVELRAGLDELGHVVISVQDNGPGLPEEDRESIFLPFFSTRPSGTGIGLSVVRQIMHAHGGRVRAHNSAEGGARFDLIFVSSERAHPRGASKLQTSSLGYPVELRCD